MLFIGSLYYTNAENRVVGLIGEAVFGEPIYFSVTIPETVKNLDGAISFVNFLLSTKGEGILESQGLNYIKPKPTSGQETERIQMVLLWHWELGRQRFTSFSNEESLSLTINSSANSINCILSLKTIGRVDTLYAV
jgi:hypothetical protein